MVVADQLGSTYICSSDDYFTANPFSPYAWKSYYAAQYQEGPTEEWCMAALDQHLATHAQQALGLLVGYGGEAAGKSRRQDDGVAGL